MFVVLLQCLQMKTLVLKVSRIGNSRGIRLPAALLRKYHITDTIVAEEKTDEIVLHPGRTSRPKLSWKKPQKPWLRPKRIGPTGSPQQPMDSMACKRVRSLLGRA